MKHLLLFALITSTLVTLLPHPVPAYELDKMPTPDGLSPGDHTLMTTHLQILSTGWDQDSVDICNTIVAKPEYDANDWITFFTDYFDTNPLTYELWEYLGYPAFWWFGEDVHLKLQEGLIAAMLVRIDDTMAQHGNQLSQALVADENLRETFVNAHRFMNEIAHLGVVGEARKQELYNYYVNYVQDWPHYWKKSSTIDVKETPYIAALAAQVQANLRDLLPLTPTRKAHIATVIDLQGQYLDLWDDFSLLIFDNNGLDQAQLDFIYNYVTAIPGPLFHLKGISVNDFLGNTGDTQLPVLLRNVNICGTPIGSETENPFPEDVAPVYCDGFIALVSHEINHSVDAEYASEQQHLRNRVRELVEQAGQPRMNYLRSMLPDGFFYEAPQEFLASIANQWFCDSTHTVQLGLARFANGYREPINQALLFADIYSAGTVSTCLYTTDRSGQITTTQVTLNRDWNDHVNAITLPEATYNFVLDDAGNVLGVGTDLPKISISPTTGFHLDLSQDTTAQRHLVISNTGALTLYYWLEITGSLSHCGHATDLRGGGGIEIANSPSLNPADQLTVEAWIYPENWEDCCGRVVQKGRSDDQYRLLVEWGDFKFDLDKVGTARLAYWKPLTGTWSHVAGTYNGQEISLYIDGHLLSTQTATMTLSTTTDPLYIGSKDDWPSNPFVGQVDEVRIWNRALTQQEIRQYMCRELSGGEAGLVGYWKLNEREGNVAGDSSALGNTGRLFGDATFAPSTSPLCKWLYFVPRLGLIPPGGQLDITAHVDTASLDPGVYTANLVLHSNDPDHGALALPVSLWVDVHTIYLPFTVKSVRSLAGSRTK